jgi:hypothetical protein
MRANNEFPDTIVYFISHASVLIRRGSTMVITDPWYIDVAFSSWTPSPPPALNPDMIIGLAATGNLAFVLSHAHPDHTDFGFLDQVPRNTPIFIPRYDDPHFENELKLHGHENVREIGARPEAFKDFRLCMIPHEKSATDAAIAVETADAFIFHGNDAWDVGAAGLQQLASIKPTHKKSLFMGQGGSASGHPLTYLNYEQSERLEKLIEKNCSMLKQIAATARKVGFDRALAYACFTKVTVEDRDYAHKAPLQNGTWANDATDEDIFIDLSPGDVFVPAKDLVIPILSSLHIDPCAYPLRVAARSFRSVSQSDWERVYASKADSFFASFEAFLRDWGIQRNVRFDELALQFHLALLDENDDELFKQSWNLLGGASHRSKTCRVRLSRMAAVLDGKMPFEDLYTGYLAEWRREPDVYNYEFVDALMAFGYSYLSKCETATAKDRPAADLSPVSKEQ